MHIRISKGLSILRVAAAISLVLGTIYACAGAKETTKAGSEGSAEFGSTVSEYEPSMSFEGYQEVYKDYYGDFTENMAEEGNPAELMLDDGKDLFNTVEGTKGKSCAGCHGENGKKLIGAAATFPKYDSGIDGIKTVALQVNMCRENAMGAEPLKYESYDQLSLAMYVKSLSNGMPINVSIDGPARKFYEAGKVFYYERKGQLNYNCAICHVKYAGYKVRANLISNNRRHVDHWPTYRLKWGKAGSLHRRFRGCMKNVRQKPLPYQSEGYRNLELYLTYINRGLPIQVPGLRM